MTTEQIAKVYDANYGAYIELVDRIECVKDAIKKQNYGIATDILYKPYPKFQIITSAEPKEGEDERIRKMLIKFFGNGAFCDSYTNGISDKDIVAWLEKQDKIVAYYEDRLDECACKYFNKGYKHALEKQGEQTPAWSEEDEEIYSRICYLIHSAAFENYDVDEVGKELGEYAKITDWLKSLKSRVSCEANCTTTKEWSEEDERNLNDAILFIETGTYSLDKDNLINWVKSLRPQNRWKPSEEQIDALEHFVRSIGESGYVSPCDNNTKLLYSLLEQLKKLKGE